MRFYLIQIVMGMLGSIGFAVLFGIYNKTLMAIALGSGAGWIVYLFCIERGYGMFVGLLFASLFVALLSEILARKFKTPVILLLVPMLIPEIPGGDLYYTMYHLVQGRFAEFGTSSNQVLAEAGAIVLGIVLASYFVKCINLCKMIVDKSWKKV